MLRTLGDLGYMVEWRVVNAAEYGFPQRRIRVLLVATREDVIPNSNPVGPQYFMEGLLPVVFPCEEYSEMKTFELSDDASVISANFNVGGKRSPFSTAGIYHRGSGLTANGSAAKIKSAPLGSVLEDDAKVPESFWIDEGKLKDWDYLKGAKSVARVSKSGHSYNYSEGKMAFPDSLDRPSRTILTGEGGSAPSRFKHIIKTDQGFRRLLPVELERLNGFPDDWTKFDMNGKEISDSKRAFFMGNALVVGLIEKVGKELIRRHFS
jgi:DNA (cytosine-5)-methyltransferase 1